MILRFKVENGNGYEVDVADLKWRRVSSLLATDGAEGTLEEGKLIPQGRGVYNLEGVEQKESGGLTTVAVNPIPEGNALTIFLQANVGVKDIEMPVAIEIIRAASVPGGSVEDRQAMAAAQAEERAKIQSAVGDTGVVTLGPNAVEPTGGVLTELYNGAQVDAEEGLTTEQGKDSIGE